MTARAQIGAWAAGLLVFGLAVFALREMLFPFVAGMAVAYLLDPIADWLERRGLSRILATVMITAMFMLVAVGAVFPTTTMSKGARQVVGVETVRKVKEMVSQPVVAIGGIDRSNVGEVVRAGADCVCVVSSVTMASDPEAAARQLVDAIEKAQG